MMMFFGYILVSVLISGIHAELPEYLHPCNSSDPEISECLEGAIHNAVEVLKDGYPGTDIPSLEPFIINHVKQDLNAFSFKISFTMKELCISNMTNFNITNITVDGYEYHMDVLFPQIKLHGNFILNLKLGKKVIENVSGTVKGVIDNLEAAIMLKGKIIHVNKNDSLEFDDMSVKLNMEKSDIAVKIKGYETMEKLINVALSKNPLMTNILFETGRSDLEYNVKSKLLSIVKEITFGYPIAELFP